jgi:type IV pilus assembly protein PilE
MVSLAAIMNTGFSLIELMIVLVLVSILGVISYPLYSEHLLRVHRICAAVTLADMAGGMERYYLLHNTYEGANAKNLAINTSRCHERYRFGVSFASENAYTLEAIPFGNQEKDILCGTLTLDHDGNKKAYGSDGGVRCWL